MSDFIDLIPDEKTLSNLIASQIESGEKAYYDNLKENEPESLYWFKEVQESVKTASDALEYIEQFDSSLEFKELRKELLKACNKIQSVKMAVHKFHYKPFNKESV